MNRRGWGLGLVLIALTALAGVLALAVGSTGWSGPQAWGADPLAWQIAWEVRAPRSMGAWLAGALLALSGALAQGVFRNPLADPYLLGSSSGAALGVAACLAWLGVGPASADVWVRLGVSGAAFLGSVMAVALTLVLARGVQHTLRLLLAGVVVGVVLGALSALTMLMVPDITRAMQAFMLGTTGFIGWPAVGTMAPVLGVCLLLALGGSRALDAMSLGDAAARSLGVSVGWVRWVLVLVLSAATGTAVAQAGLISFVGLVAPHLVRSVVSVTHGALMVLSCLAGGLLLLLADVLARWLIAPQELPVGVLTAVLGGSYLLWRMNRSSGGLA